MSLTQNGSQSYLFRAHLTNSKQPLSMYCNALKYRYLHEKWNTTANIEDCLKKIIYILNVFITTHSGHSLQFHHKPPHTFPILTSLVVLNQRVMTCPCYKATSVKPQAREWHAVTLQFQKSTSIASKIFMFREQMSLSWNPRDQSQMTSRGDSSQNRDIIRCVLLSISDFYSNLTGFKEVDRERSCNLYTGWEASYKETQQPLSCWIQSRYTSIN